MIKHLKCDIKSHIIELDRGNFMNNTKYQIVKVGKEYGFKVAFSNPNGNVTEREYKSLSSSKQEVEKFILLLQRNEVSQIHIEDLIDDFFFSY